MSSDMFDIRAKKVSPDEVVFDIMVGSAGEGICITRSFALDLLMDALRQKKLDATHLQAAVTEAGVEFGACYAWPKDWWGTHLGNFVKEVEVLEPKGVGQANYDIKEYKLRAKFADAKWLEPIQSLCFGSTCFDHWWEDPQRPAVPSVEVHPADRWDDQDDW